MLRTIVADKILNQVLPLVQDKTPPSARRQSAGTTWRILVLDSLATHILNWCCTMQQLTDRDVTLVEDIEKKRQPTDFEAIYICQPTERNIQMLCDDFDPSVGKLYKVGHVFFLTPCDDELFNRIVQSPCRQFLRTITEINVAFMPLESRIFSCSRHEPDAIRMLRGKRLDILEIVAEQIATLCATLKEYPHVRFRKGCEVNLVLAQLLQQKLDQLKMDEPEMGQGYEKQQSQLILIDRSFDVKSPLLHELSYQALAHDLSAIDDKGAMVMSSATSLSSSSIAADSNDNDDAGRGVSVELKPVQSNSILDENDTKWVQLRHLHIADVLKKLSKEYKLFSEQQREARDLSAAVAGGGGGGSTGNGAVPNIKKLKYLIKKMPQHQRSLHEYVTHMKLTEDCLRIYNERQLQRLCLAEQALASGSDAEGEKVKDPMRSLVPILLDSKYSAMEKLRLIALYILWRDGSGGISQESLDKLIQHAQIPTALRPLEVLSNLQYFGIEVLELGAQKRLPVSGVSMKRVVYRRRDQRNNQFVDDNDDDDADRAAADRRRDGKQQHVQQHYETARWTPVVKDVMQDAIEGTLSVNDFPYLSNGQEQQVMMMSAVGSARQRGNNNNSNNNNNNTWRSGGPNDDPLRRYGPRLIVFMLGGMSYSEMRCAYEVSEQYQARNWEVILGSTHVLTPEVFVDNLRTLGEE